MKVLLLVVLLGFVATATACNKLQRLKVKQQWAEAFGRGDAREDFGVALWRGIFNQDPAARNLFKRVNGDDEESPEFLAHSQRVLGGLDMVIALLDMPGTDDAQLAHLKGQHATRNIPRGAFTTFKNALMASVGASLGRCFDRDAWSACYDLIADGIMS